MSEVDVVDLQKLIKEKKESKDYYTIKNGLITERDCFEAIEAFGYRLQLLKAEIQKKLDMHCDNNDPQLQALLVAAQNIQKLQETVVNDVCNRFEVIHPKFKSPSPELLMLKQPYWDWYRDQYKKCYGRPAPEIVDA